MAPRFAIDSHARSWLLDKFAMGRTNYWFTFVVDFATAMFFLVWEMVPLGHFPAWVLFAFALGFVTWGLTEYAFHRWVYHQPDGIFGEGHHIHHTEASLLIAMPWFMTTLTMFGLWHVGSRILGVPYFSTFLAGWLIGFVWYSLVHHSHHHWRLKNIWIRRLKAYHRVHHQFPKYNYGVTMRFWDVVFGTLYRKSSEGGTGGRPVETRRPQLEPEQQHALAEA